MITLRIGEIITELRKKKSITQDELAEFLGVTKASVSKWETKQSCPDIMLIPQIAAFFGISTDTLLGYEPQLSPEQIRKIYTELANDFSNKPFDEVVAESKALVKKYYSCYKFIEQIIILWINHSSLIFNTDKYTDFLHDIIGLCDHLIKDSNDVNQSSDAIVLKAFTNLQLGNIQDVIEALESKCELNNYKLEADSLLIQAYQMSNNKEKAEYYSQINLYINIMHMISNSIYLLNIQIDDKEKCEETIHRITEVIKVYDIDNLNPNASLQFYYLCAVFYCKHQCSKDAMEILKKFVYGSIDFILNKFYLHGDKYFNRLNEWYDGYVLGNDSVRNKKLVYDSIITSIQNPQFSILFDNAEYKNLVDYLKSKGDSIL